MGNHEGINGRYKVAMCMRAVAEPMLVSHFGEGIIDELFHRYTKIILDSMSTCPEKSQFINVTVSNLILHVSRIKFALNYFVCLVKVVGTYAIDSPYCSLKYVLKLLYSYGELVVFLLIISFANFNKLVPKVFGGWMDIFES